MLELVTSVPFIVLGALGFGLAIGVNIRGVQRRQRVGAVLTVLLLFAWGLSTAYVHPWAIPLSIAIALITAWLLAVNDFRNHPLLHGESFAKRLVLVLIHETKLRRSPAAKREDAASEQTRTTPYSTTSN